MTTINNEFPALTTPEGCVSPHSEISDSDTSSPIVVKKTMKMKKKRQTKDEKHAQELAEQQAEFAKKFAEMEAMLAEQKELLVVAKTTKTARVKVVEYYKHSFCEEEQMFILQDEDEIKRRILKSKTKEELLDYICEQGDYPFGDEFTTYEDKDALIIKKKGDRKEPLTQRCAEDGKRCYAYKFNGTRCQHPKTENDYCKIHNNTLKRLDGRLANGDWRISGSGSAPHPKIHIQRKVFASKADEGVFYHQDLQDDEELKARVMAVVFGE